ncbi:MAG: AMP-binding protein, partial [Planctomycetes bacterium]|nr:AMP-binding protein [Planctomycetota bacterium]
PEVAAGLEPGLLVLTPIGLEASSPGGAALPTDPGAPAILQITSGSTATPKAVTLSHGALLANCRQIQVAARIEPGDVMVSWLPLFHDMGFLAAVSSPVALGLELVLSSPRVFLRDPLSWLRAISELRGTHCGAPSFAYRYLLERSAQRALPALDLSSWKVGCVGAEPIHGPTLRACNARFAPLGLAPSTLTPSYGMAEATLALTMKPYAAEATSLYVERGALARGELALDPAGVELPSSGEPLAQVELSIRDPQGEALPEGRVGEVWARSPSLFSGYWGRGREGFSSTRHLRTGDLGFLYQGELYVTGRSKETIILRGENHAPAEIEWAAEVAGVRPGRVVAFGRANPATATEDLVLLVEVERGTDHDALGVAIRRAVFERTELVVNDLELVPRGTLPVTTSGKLRRTAAPELFAKLRGRATP